MDDNEGSDDRNVTNDKTLNAYGRVRNVKNEVLKLNSFITAACYLC